jgi:peptidoglycan/LPS O-acetylase OafA/YrhL
MPDYAPFFAGGMLLYLVYRDGHDLGTWLLIGMQALFALNFAMSVYPGVLAAETPWPPSKVAIALVTFACFALVALVTLTRVARWDMRWMTVAGALTYPVYLVHENLGWYVISLLRGHVDPWVAVLAATAAALLAAVALHHLVEKRFGNRLRKATLAMLRTTARGRADAAPAAAPARHSRGRHGEPAPAPRHGEPSTAAMRAVHPGLDGRPPVAAPVQRSAGSALSGARTD